MKILITSALLIIFSVSLCHAQILISLLFGDKLNSDKLEFGLEGGANFTNMSNVPGANVKTGLDLGFYLDFKLQNNLYIHTGVLGKSPMGTKGLPPYSIGDANLDQAFATGSVKRKLSYFHVPILLRYKFHKHLFVEGGPQLGLLNKALDKFKASVKNSNDLTFENKVFKEYRKIDIGMTVGLGYRILKNQGMNLGIRYYAGLVNVSKDGSGPIQHNSAFYIFAGIPVGAGKAQAKSAEQLNE